MYPNTNKLQDQRNAHPLRNNRRVDKDGSGPVVDDERKTVRARTPLLAMTHILTLVASPLANPIGEIISDQTNTRRREDGACIEATTRSRLSLMVTHT